MYVSIVSDECMLTPNCTARINTTWHDNANYNHIQSCLQCLILVLDPTLWLILSLLCVVVFCHTPKGKCTQPDGNLGGLCQSAPCALQSSVDLSHLYDSFQPHHLQTLISHVWGVKTHPQIKFRWPGRDYWQHPDAIKSRVSPWEIVLRSSGSVMTSLCSTSCTLSGFLDSPQRLEPPCMLGMLRTAMPSKDMPLRSRDFPQHWWKQNNRWLSIHTTEQKQAMTWSTNNW